MDGEGVGRVPDFGKMAEGYLALAGVSVDNKLWQNTVGTLNLCHRLGQLGSLDGGGIIGWLRADEDTIGIIRDSNKYDLGAISGIGDDILTSGSYLYIAEVLALQRGVPYGAIRKLTRMPGVQWLTGWRSGRWVERRVRHV